MLAQPLYHYLDQHRGNGCPEEVKAPGNAVREIRDDAEQTHKAKGKRVGDRNEADLDRELIHRLVIGDLLILGDGIPQRIDRPSAADGQPPRSSLQVDIQHAEDAGDHKADRGKRETEATVARKLRCRRVGEVDVPAQRVSGTLTEGQRQDQTANIGDHAFSVLRNEEQKDRDTEAEKRLQHIGAALKRTELNDLGAARFMETLLCLQRHRGEADRKAVIGDDLHHLLIDHVEAERLQDHIQNEKHRAAEQRRRNEALTEESDLSSQDIAEEHKEEQQAELDQKGPDGTVVCQAEIPIHIDFLSVAEGDRTKP